MVTAAMWLSSRVGMDRQVMFQVGDLESLPVREGVFTHAWLVDTPLQRRAAEKLTEAMRVLRPGGHFALQCASADAESFYRLLGDLGFIELQRREMSFGDLPHGYHLAAERLHKALEANPKDAAIWRDSIAPANVRAAIHIFGRRPA